jgi:cohesin loading factor subunit SCC2
VEGSATTTSSSTSPALVFLLKNNTNKTQSHRRLLGDVFQALSATLPKINALLNVESVSMSETLIIQAVYIAIDPFFVVDPSGEHEGALGSSKGGNAATPSKKKDKEREGVVSRTFGKSAMRGLRLDALALIRSVSVL